MSKKFVPAAFMPRLRGRVVQDGKAWTYEMYVTIGPDTDNNTITLGPPKGGVPFLTDLAALNAMKAEMPNLMRLVCEAVGAPMPDAVLNLKDGVVQSMDDFAAPKTPGAGGA